MRVLTEPPLKLFGIFDSKDFFLSIDYGVFAFFEFYLFREKYQF